MLTLKECLVLLVSSHPSLERANSEVVDEWRPDDPPPTVLASTIAKALVHAAEGTSDDELRLLFARVEQILSDGEDVAKDVVTTGFLEALVAASDCNRTGAERLMQFLGPLAHAYCNEWKLFTQGR